MKKFFAGAIACLATMLVGTSSCTADNNTSSSTSTSDSFSFTKTGIASVKVGADYTRIPDSIPGLYSSVSFFVRCGGEDGDGVDVFYNNEENSSDCIINAHLIVDDSAIETFYENGLECAYYLLSDPKIANLLKQTGSTRIGAITVSPSPRITVNIDGKEIPTTEPAIKFAEMPDAVTTVSLGEGPVIDCYIGDLTMTTTNAYEALTPEALERIGPKLAAAIETGYFEPITLTASDLNPTALFEYFYY